MTDPAAHSVENSQQLLQRFVAADPDAAAEIVDRYLTRLLPLIRRRLSKSLRTRIDPEDVAQSTFRTFFLKAQDDHFTLEKPGDLWRLLAAISLKTLGRQVERHTASKRSVAREVTTDHPLSQHDPRPGEVEALLEEIEVALQAMPPDAREVISQILAGKTVEEIAETSDKSARTLRRWLQIFRETLKRRLHPQDERAIQDNAILLWQDYMLKQHVGSGGFGKVYRAVELQRNRTVAIKSLHKRHQRDQWAVRQFVREAQIMAKVCHPSIVGVHGLGQYPGGGYFLVMDWVDGENLQQKVNRAPLPVAEAVRIVNNVVGAISAAHHGNVLHGDLKPANILISRQNAVYVADFGLASLRSQTLNTNTIRGGTLAYLAPEQLTNTPLDFSVDVYGLGGLLYSILTGRPPRTGSPDTILGDLERGIPPVPPSCWGISLPSQLEALVMNCLASDPAARLPTVEQFRLELKAFCEAES